MNIYEYFNSTDIAEHCKKLEYSFTGWDMALLISQSNHHTLQEKAQAWQEIINTMPDEYDDEGSLHQFLSDYIGRQQRFIADFQTNMGKFVYTYEKVYKEVRDQYSNESMLYTSYEECVKTAVAEVAQNPHVLCLHIRKKKLYNSPTKWMGRPSLYLTTKGEPVHMGAAQFHPEQDFLNPPCNFDDLWIDLPIPFKRGDVVCWTDSLGRCGGPAVIDVITEKEADTGCWGANLTLYELDQHGCIDINVDVNYLSLEYYRCELKGRAYFLEAMQRYLQRKIALDELIRAYSVTMLEQLSHHVWLDDETR